MNKYLILTVIILSIILVGLTKGVFYLKSEVDRKDNNIIAIIKDNARQQELKEKEFKEYYSENFQSELSKLKLKLKDVTNVVTTEINIKDSTRIKNLSILDTTYNNPILKKYKFVDNSKCFKVEGNSYIDYANKKLITEITNREFNDSLEVFEYKKWEHRILFIKWKKSISTKAYLKCSGIEVPVIQNIKIVK